MKSTGEVVRNLITERIKESVKEHLQTPESRTLIRTIVEEVLAERHNGPSTDELEKMMLQSIEEAFADQGASEAPPASNRGRARKAPSSSKTCLVIGCNRPYRSMGYCATHYQIARKNKDWPMPATEPVTPPESYRPRSK